VSGRQDAECPVLQRFFPSMTTFAASGRVLRHVECRQVADIDFVSIAKNWEDAEACRPVWRQRPGLQPCCPRCSASGAKASPPCCQHLGVCRQRPAAMRAGVSGCRRCRGRRVIWQATCGDEGRQPEAAMVVDCSALGLGDGRTASKDRQTAVCQGLADGTSGLQCAPAAARFFIVRLGTLFVDNV
jgi:hypothetical protein